MGGDWADAPGRTRIAHQERTGERRAGEAVRTYAILPIVYGSPRSQ